MEIFTIIYNESIVKGEVAMKRYDELNNKGKRNLEEFLTITFEFTDEQLAAIDYQIPMTQEIYDSILDRCMVLGSSVDNLFYRLLVEYPDFMTVYANRIEQEVEEKYSDIDFAFCGAERTPRRFRADAMQNITDALKRSKKLLNFLAGSLLCNASSPA